MRYAFLSAAVLCFSLLVFSNASAQYMTVDEIPTLSVAVGGVLLDSKLEKVNRDIALNGAVVGDQLGVGVVPLDDWNRKFFGMFKTGAINSFLVHRFGERKQFAGVYGFDITGKYIGYDGVKSTHDYPGAETFVPALGSRVAGPATVKWNQAYWDFMLNAGLRYYFNPGARWEVALHGNGTVHFFRSEAKLDAASDLTAVPGIGAVLEQQNRLKFSKTGYGVTVGVVVNYNINKKNAIYLMPAYVFSWGINGDTDLVMEDYLGNNLYGTDIIPAHYDIDLPGKALFIGYQRGF